MKKLLLLFLLIPAIAYAWGVLPLGGGVSADSCTAGTNTGTFSETFDQTASYDEGWTVGGGTPDSDSTNATILAECGFNTQMLRTNSTGSSNYIKYNKTDTWGPEYKRVYFYIDSEGLSDSDSLPIIQTDNGIAGVEVTVTQTAGQLQLTTSYGGNIKATWSIAIDTTYRLEVYVEDTSGEVGAGEVRLYLADSESLEESWSGVINITQAGTEDRLGVVGSSATIDIYFDYYDSQTTGWVGK